MRNSIKFSNALVHNIFGRSQRNYAHVMTAALLWHVQHFVVIGWAHFKPDPCNLWSNYELDQNTISGTSARDRYIVLLLASPWYPVMAYKAVPMYHYGFFIVFSGSCSGVRYLFSYGIFYTFDKHVITPIQDAKPQSWFITLVDYGQLS